jgi:quinol monooxygenase YgiN
MGMRLNRLRWLAAGLVAAGGASAAGQAYAQDLAENSSYMVSYYETVAASQPAPGGPAPDALLAHYRDSARQEPGVVSVEVLTDLGRSTRYVVIEQWNSPEALARHQTAASSLQLKQQLAAWLTDPSDQRVHVKFK